MKRPLAHWEAREWEQNQDLLVLDPKRPQAFPGKCPTDLLGRIRVRLTAEDGNLVAYGFGGQRIVLPSESVGAVNTVSAFRMGGFTRGRALLVLDHDQRILLRAPGMWETHGEVAAVCKVARVHAPKHLTPSIVSRPRGTSGKRRSTSTTRQVPRFEKARGYRRLRVNPRSRPLRVLVLVVLFAVAIGIGVSLGVWPAVALPQWFGALRTLLGIVGAVAGAAGGVWAALAVAHVFADTLRWGLTSTTVGTLAPPRRFFRRRERAGGWTVLGNICLVALVPALVYWGPGIGIASLAHGFRDSALVASLRAHGTQTRGELIDVQDFSTDDNDNTTVKDVPTLSFRGWQTADPSIGGRPLPLEADDPLSTRQPLTVVYLPSDPDTAAAAQQLAGSVWHGAPTANLISGGLLTLALPPVLWLLVLAVRRRRWRRARRLVDDLAG